MKSVGKIGPWLEIGPEATQTEIYAGSLAHEGQRLVVGTVSGHWASFHYPSLARESEGRRWFEEACHGVQIVGSRWALLGNDRAQNETTPGDWDSRLRIVSPEGDRLLDDWPLGPGNWWLLPGLRENLLLVYDVTEEQGVRAFDLRKGPLWTAPVGSPRHLVRSPSGVAALVGQEIVILEDEAGEICWCSTLPETATHVWTSLAPSGAQDFILGGHRLDGSAFAFARWRLGESKVDSMTHSPVADHFTPETLGRALDDPCCGVDIHHVAGFAPLGGQQILAILGGRGRGPGACQSACAAVKVDTAKLALGESLLIDTEDGCSGLVAADDGRVLVDCCGTVYAVDAR